MLAVDGGSSYSLAEGRSGLWAFGQHWVTKPGAAHLGRIIVSPEARGKGIGRVLCERLIDAAVQSTGAIA